MKLSQSIQSSLWMLIFLNILMAFAGIWLFFRMMPDIDNLAKTSEIVATNSVEENSPSQLTQSQTLLKEKNQQLQNIKGECKTGAWLLVFMAFIFFLASLALMRSVKRLLIQPMENISDVLHDRERGDIFRRCPGKAPHHDILSLYTSVNKILNFSPKSNDEQQR